MALLNNHAFPPPHAPLVEAGLARRYRQTREFTSQLAAPLSAEDCAIQSMPDASPTRWHLAHTTWFFETFLLKALPAYRPFDDHFEYLFNSYYNAVGEQFPRDRRGLISRPDLSRIQDYRRHVDHHLLEALEHGELASEVGAIIELGLNHEQQHQELVLTDIKHVLSCNPLFPAYQTGRSPDATRAASATPRRYASFPEGLIEVGHDGPGFAFDNESPRHKSYRVAHEIATRCVTNAEYLQFIEDGGYERAELWLSLGWFEVQSRRWRAPLYWLARDGEWFEFTLAGLKPLQSDAPVCHVSFFEADAFARWAGCRLPTEWEWEAANGLGAGETFADRLALTGMEFHPQASSERRQPTGAPPMDDQLSDLFGNVWEWTNSQYLPYPGYRPPDGALGEYNGKFMCNQFVLRGGSCATSSTHFRPTYRNFFPPEARWQFSGIRLAR